jgi:hypothetical protein
VLCNLEQSEGQVERGLKVGPLSYELNIRVELGSTPTGRPFGAKSESTARESSHRLCCVMLMLPPHIAEHSPRDLESGCVDSVLALA